MFPEKVPWMEDDNNHLQAVHACILVLPRYIDQCHIAT